MQTSTAATQQARELPFVPLSAAELTACRYDWQQMARSLREHGLTVNKTGFVLVAVTLQRLIRLGLLKPASLTDAAVLTIASAATKTGDLLGSVREHRDMWYEDRDPDELGIAAQISDALASERSPSQLSFCWVTRAIACSDDDGARNIARKVDMACIAASSSDSNEELYWRAIHSTIPDIRNMMLTPAERDAQARVMQQRQRMMETVAEASINGTGPIAPIDAVPSSSTADTTPPNHVSAFDQQMNELSRILTRQGLNPSSITAAPPPPLESSTRRLDDVLASLRQTSLGPRSAAANGQQAVASPVDAVSPAPIVHATAPRNVEGGQEGYQDVRDDAGADAEEGGESSDEDGEMRESADEYIRTFSAPHYRHT